MLEVVFGGVVVLLPVAVATKAETMVVVAIMEEASKQASTTLAGAMATAIAIFRLENLAG
jgi:hypothetical protein